MKAPLIVALLVLSTSCLATSGDLARIEAQVNAAIADGIVTPDELAAVHSEVVAVKQDVEARAEKVAEAAGKASVLGLPGGGVTDLVLSLAAAALAIRQRHKLGLSGPPPKREPAE